MKLQLVFFVVLVNKMSTASDEEISRRPELDEAMECRTKELSLLNSSQFHFESCALCYEYMAEDFFLPDEKLKQLSVNRSHSTSSQYDTWQSMTLTFKSETGVRMWQECCHSANKCCQEMSEKSNRLSEEASFCERQWDGWQCIPDTPVNRTIQIPCPSYIYFYSEPPDDGCSNYATKTCFGNGSWEYKTDYTSCGHTDSLRRRMLLNIGAFALSLLFLVPALFIFAAYNQLKVPRVTLHINLFLALILHAIAVILYKSVISLNALQQDLTGSNIVTRNWGDCKLALIVIKYTRMTTYMWMFCEGFYLHKLIIASFAEERRLLVYYLIGWVFPVFPVATYAVMRKLYADQECWMMSEDGYDWIIYSPMLLALMLNLIFLCNILRVLITKLKFQSTEPHQYRKAVRATLMLVPLFGVHFLLIIYLPNQASCGAFEAYTYFSFLIDGIQGFIVSLILCYFNGETLSLLSRSFNTFRLQKMIGAAARSRPMDI